MRIKELKLHNFRGIKDLHLIFNPKYNVVVLAGVNGVGKSSILNCINILIKYYNMEYRQDRYPRSLGSPNDVSIMSDLDAHIGTSDSINQIKVNFGRRDVEWEISQSSKYISNSSRRYLNTPSRILGDNIRENTDNKTTHKYFFYLANRQVIDLEKSWKIKSKDIINFEDFSKWFKETEDLENERRLSDDIDYRHPVITAVRLATYSLLGSGYSNLTFKRAIDRMTIKKSGREINLELLSDGEKSLLAMIGHLSKNIAEGSENTDNPLEDSALVLIDEIELHLHPEWQRMIIPRLTKTFPNCQFIVTTHSPQVLSHVDPECIHILDYDGDNVIVKRPESSYGLDSNRILEDILGVSKRPQEIQERMLELFRTINNNDLDSAKEIVQELGDRIGINEPELVKAEATIKRREIIGR
jgi:predicted ATP-binding protein involved in virulence